MNPNKGDHQELSYSCPFLWHDWDMCMVLDRWCMAYIRFSNIVLIHSPAYIYSLLESFGEMSKSQWYEYVNWERRKIIPLFCFDVLNINQKIRSNQTFCDQRKINLQRIFFITYYQKLYFLSGIHRSFLFSQSSPTITVFLLGLFNSKASYKILLVTKFKPNLWRPICPPHKFCLSSIENKLVVDD